MRPAPLHDFFGKEYNAHQRAEENQYVITHRGTARNHIKRHWWRSGFHGSGFRRRCCYLGRRQGWAQILKTPRRFCRRQRATIPRKPLPRGGIPAEWQRRLPAIIQARQPMPGA